MRAQYELTKRFSAELVARVSASEEIENRIVYLPLR